MNKILFATILFLLINLSSCITTLSPGFFYNNTAEHVYLNRSTSQLGSGRILKMEKTCTYSSIFLEPFYHGKHTNASTVVKKAGINKIGVIDYSSFSILGPLYYSNCIIVWGEDE